MPAILDLRLILDSEMRASTTGFSQCAFVDRPAHIAYSRRGPLAAVAIVWSQPCSVDYFHS